MKFGELIGVTLEEKSLTFIAKKVLSEHWEFGKFIETTIGTPNYYFQNASDELLHSEVRIIHVISKNEIEVYVK